MRTAAASCHPRRLRRGTDTWPPSSRRGGGRAGSAGRGGSSSRWCRPRPRSRRPRPSSGAGRRQCSSTAGQITAWPRELTYSRPRTYRGDTSSRYIGPICSSEPQVRGTCFVLELAVLGLLKETPMSGYELKKQLTVKLGAFWRVSYGSLYPCLKQLAGDGALDVEVAPFTSRKKHVYRLTERGNRLFHKLLESADMHDLEQDRFSLRLAFFRYLRPA